MKLNDTIYILDHIFGVTTTTRFMLIYAKPHSVVIPLRLNGRFTTERGFLVHYTTDEQAVLEEWHSLLCNKVRAGMYEEMLEHARTGLFPLDEDEMHLAPYVKGFRCS